MTRRRLEGLGRLAFQVASELHHKDSKTPVVYASRYGEAFRSAQLLDALAKDGAVPPTSFALSVHNAVISQYSIASGTAGPISAVAQGRFSVEAGVLEALSLLNEGHSSVTFIVAERSLPELYQPFADEPVADFAWGCTLTSGSGFSLTRLREPTSEPSSAIPHALEVLRFLLQTDAFLQAGDSSGRWRWERHA
jgi:hypothetical protein